MAEQQHDPAYKRLFSQPEMIRELLVEYVHEDWVRELDFATLEKQNGSYATEDYRGRHDDVIWRVRWGEDWLYVYLLLEFLRPLGAARAAAPQALRRATAASRARDPRSGGGTRDAG